MKVFILTGAGISAESGVKTFRDFDNGIWNGENLEDVCEKGCFEANPSLVYGFYENLKNMVVGCEPNDAHKIVADIQKKHEVMLVTQNIDNLHEKAGSTNVYHMHGSLFKGYCVSCGETFENYAFNSINCSECGENGSVRHDIVFFGEHPYHLDEMMDFIGACDFFVAIGTSGVVYPAAGLVEYAHAKGVKNRVFVNISKEDRSFYFNHSLIGKATDKLNDLYAMLEE